MNFSLHQLARDNLSDSGVTNSKSAAAAWKVAGEQMLSVEKLLRVYTNSPGHLGEVVEYHLSSGGKRFRPMFLLAVGAAVDADPHNSLQLSAAVELLHNASLVHDDLQDKDEFRRGKETVWRRFGTEMAINLGDLFISSTYAALASINSGGDVVAKVVALFADSTRRIISGQSEEIRLSRQIDIEPATYHRIARGKSGILMALPVVSVLTIAGSATEIVDNARLAMENLGVAYQIQDDLSDLFGCKDGRPAGVDLREGRMSLPIIYYLSSATESDRQLIATILASDRKMDRSEFAFWLNRIRASHAPDLCREDIRVALQTAAKHLELVPPVLQRTLEIGTEMVTSAMEDQMQRPSWYTAN